jgi:type 1 glutamine amidotransferase
MVTLALAALAITSTQDTPNAVVQGSPEVLVFSRTTGFRHDAIPEATEAVLKMGKEKKFTVSATEDPSVFNDAYLSKVKVVVFLLTTGDILNTDQKASMEKFVRKGGGYVGVHSASDTEYNWPFYGRLVGAYFKSHPHIQDADVHIEDPKHPTMAGLPKVWRRKDEWYDFRESPRSKVKVLASIDEKSYQNGKMGDDHPVIWYHEFEGGRSWYTALGHTKESYKEPLFLNHLYQGIVWAGKARRR